MWVLEHKVWWGQYGVVLYHLVCPLFCNSSVEYLFPAFLCFGFKKLDGIVGDTCQSCDPDFLGPHVLLDKATTFGRDVGWSCVWYCWSTLFWLIVASGQRRRKMSLSVWVEMRLISTIVDWHYSWLLQEEGERCPFVSSQDKVDQHNCWSTLPVDCCQRTKKGGPFVSSWEEVNWHNCWLTYWLIVVGGRRKELAYFILSSWDEVNQHNCWSTLLVNCQEGKEKQFPFESICKVVNQDNCWSTSLVDCWERKEKWGLTL